MSSCPSQSQVKPYHDPRLPSLEKVAKILKVTRESIAQARKYNQKITDEDQKEFHRAGLKAVAKKFYDLAIAIPSNPETLNIYGNLLEKHFEQEIKREKIALMRRHLQLLEQKQKALEDAVRNSGSDAEIGETVRRIFGHDKSVSNNGHRNQNEAPRLLGNGFPS
jgi:hypothetical protein